jgi:hypothetical protein
VDNSTVIKQSLNQSLPDFDREISREMGLSENTVKKYVYRNVRRFAMQKITAQMSMTHAV